jgi:hypothetical protein
MDLTIKGIPTQAIADRLMGVARNLTDAYIEGEAKRLSTEKQTQVLADKDAFREANDLPSLQEEREELTKGAGDDEGTGISDIG